MTRYVGLMAAIVGQTGAIGLAVAKRLVEGGARVVLTAATAAQRTHAAAELGSAGLVVAPAALEGGSFDGHQFDLVVADGVRAARPVLPRLADAGAVVLIDPVPAACVQTLADELAPRAVRVNAVAPGCIEATTGATSLPPLGRFGSVEEVARAALFLATDATFTTGARLPVDGGVRPPDRPHHPVCAPQPE